MHFNNKKVAIFIYAVLAAGMIFIFQNCSANLFTAATAVKAEACEKEFLPVSDMIRSSEREIQVTKQKLKAPKKKGAVTAKLGAKAGSKKLGKVKMKTQAESVTNKPTRKAASQGDMRIKLKKIKTKKIRRS